MKKNAKMIHIKIKIIFFMLTIIKIARKSIDIDTVYTLHQYFYQLAETTRIKK